MAINCMPFVSYVGDLLIPGKALSERAVGSRQDYLDRMKWANLTLWTSGVACGVSALVFKFTAEKPVVNTISKFGIRLYASLAVLVVVVSFARFCKDLADQRL